MYLRVEFLQNPIARKRLSQSSWQRGQMRGPWSNDPCPMIPEVLIVIVEHQ